MNSFLYQSPVSYRTQVLSLNGLVNTEEIKSAICEKEGLPPGTELNVWLQTKRLTEDELLLHQLANPQKGEDDCVSFQTRSQTNSSFNTTSSSKSTMNHFGPLTLDVRFALVGGKGGFGSMLRAIGAQIEKTTNREACRDLSGRRLRDVNEEKRLKEWLKKQAEKKDEAGKRKKEKLRRLAEATVPASCSYDDEEHELARAEIPEIVEKSIIVGLQMQKQNEKAKKEAKEAKEKELILNSEPGPSRSGATKRKLEETEEGESQSSSSNSSTSADPKPSTSTSETVPQKDKKPTIKKQALWLGVDIGSDDDDDDSSDSEDNN